MLNLPPIVQKIKFYPSFFCFPSAGHSILHRKCFKCFMGTANFTKPSTSSWRSAVLNLLKAQKVDEARGILNRISCRDVDLCTMMIMGYSQNHRLEDALQLFYEMPVKDTVSWNAMIKGCLECGDLSTARGLFERMPVRNVISWTTMMNGFSKHGDIKKAEELFHEMPSKDVAAWNAMIHGHCSQGRIEDALKLFKEMPSRNVISWTSIISGLEQHGRSHDALALFKEMVGSFFKPTSSTSSCALTACANIAALYQGVQIHACVVKLGYSFCAYVCSSLITFYARCYQMMSAHKVFYELLHPNVVVWTALLTGCGLNQKHSDALKVFSNMLKMDVLPNESSLVSALNSSCALETLDGGKEIHSVAIRLGFERNAFLGNSLVVLYSSCGCTKECVAAFNNIAEKNIVSWNSVIVGCAQNGLGRWSLVFFTKMIHSGIEPDEITFTGLLSACSRSGMLEKGRCFFDYINQHTSMEVKLEHYACMVDILGRLGRLEEAENLVNNMPIKPNAMIWLALLSACKMHSDIQVAERAANSIFSVDPYCSSAIVLLSNLYASTGRWSDVSRIRERMKQKAFVKQPGHSWISPSVTKYIKS